MNLNPEQKTAIIESISESLTAKTYQNNALRLEINRLNIALEDMQTIKAQSIALERKAVSCLISDNNDLRESLNILRVRNSYLENQVMILVDGIEKSSSYIVALEKAMKI